jgi:hypothetical protein
MSRQVLPALAFAILAISRPALAGMPTPLPEDYERVFRLTDAASERLQAISFFVVGVLAAAGAVQFLWNRLRKDFVTLPRLSYGRALCGVILWGLVSVVVLTMISGARELMTPGAWKKQGFTYRLAEQPAEAGTEPSADTRRRNLEQLRAALWHFAALHEGRFPERGRVPGFDPSIWLDPESGVPYLYATGLRADTHRRLLACEPESDHAERWVLFTNSEISLLDSSAVEDLWHGGKPQ